jgi:hypothetical protein
MTTSSRSAALVAAITGPLLLVVSFAQAPDGPSLLTATAPQIQAYARSHADALRLGALAALVSIALLLSVTAAVTTILRAASPRSMLPDLYAGASYLLLGAFFLAAVAGGLPANLPDLAGGDTPSPEMLIAWHGIAGFAHLAGDFQMVFIAVLTGAFSLAAWRTRVVARWVSVLGAAVAAAAAAGTVGVTLNSAILYGFWFGGMFGWVLWLPITGVALAVRTRTGRRQAPHQAAEAAVPGPMDRERDAAI